MITMQEKLICHPGPCAECAKHIRFAGWRIRQNETIPWIPWGSLTPMNVSLGHVKTMVFSEQIASIIPKVLGRVRTKAKYRFDVYSAVNGAHIEAF